MKDSPAFPLGEGYLKNNKTVLKIACFKFGCEMKDKE